MVVLPDDLCAAEMSKCGMLKKVIFRKLTQISANIFRLTYFIDYVIFRVLVKLRRYEIKIIFFICVFRVHLRKTAFDLKTNGPK